jgi:uncharacterized protein (DUF1330 family)
MNSKLKLAGLALASMGIGVVGGTILHAQTAMPPAYLIAELQVTDAEVFKQYLAALPATFARYKVKTLARGTPASLDGSAPPSGAVAVFAFNTMDDVKAFLELTRLSGDHPVAGQVVEEQDLRGSMRAAVLRPRVIERRHYIARRFATFAASVASWRMSALRSKADMRAGSQHVRLGPKPDMAALIA